MPVLLVLQTAFKNVINETPKNKIFWNTQKWFNANNKLFNYFTR